MIFTRKCLRGETDMCDTWDARSWKYAWKFAIWSSYETGRKYSQIPPKKNEQNLRNVSQNRFSNITEIFYDSNIISLSIIKCETSKKNPIISLSNRQHIITPRRLSFRQFLRCFTMLADIQQHFFVFPNNFFRLNQKSPLWTVVFNCWKKISNVQKNVWHQLHPNCQKLHPLLMNQNGKCHVVDNVVSSSSRPTRSDIRIIWIQREPNPSSLFRMRKALENRTNMEDDRVSILEAQLTQAKLIAEESDRKYMEVETSLRRNNFFI